MRLAKFIACIHDASVRFVLHSSAFVCEISSFLGSHWVRELAWARLCGGYQYPDWLAANMRKGQRVGIDAHTISARAAEALKETLAEKSIELVCVESNPVRYPLQMARTFRMLPCLFSCLCALIPF